MSTSPDAASPLPTRNQGLPTRVPTGRPGGRHRRPEAPEIPQGAPPLVLAVPGPANPALDEVVREVALLARAGRPGLDIRPALLGEGATDLTPVLGPVAGPAAPESADAFTADSADGFTAEFTDEPGGFDVDAPEAGRTPETADEVREAAQEAAQEAADRVAADVPASAGPAVVVPLLIGPHPEIEARVRATVEASGRHLLVTEPLGPHPLLAEALHERLSEAGLARADRARLFTVVTAADGIVLATTGGAEALQSADMTGVLLAARLALPVVTADLEVPGSVARAAAGLRQMGAERLALAPYVLGPDLEPGLVEAAAEEAGCTAAESLGAHGAIAQLVLRAYLDAAGIRD
ncbi:sirohydrochlorin chelatase [Streptodolium elevatio]